MSRPTWTRRSRRCCRRAPSWRRIRRRFWPRSTSRTSCSRRGRVSARSPPGSPRSRTTWRSCFPPGSARRSSDSCRRVSLRLPRGAVLEIDPMTDVLRIVAGLLGGGIAAGVAFYALGPRVERRPADAAARAGGAGRHRAPAAPPARDLKEQARRNADKEAKKILALAIQRLAPESTAETTVSTVALPSDEMKGRIIGREGRNIRAFEAATGVDVIIDDTPDTVVVSCFDPVRREIARLALERLIADGRIHPGRIEEIARKAQAEVEAGIVEAGEQAVYDTGVRGMHAELVKLVGRMKYRTSYGQNILEHSKEVAFLARMIAADLKLDVHLAKRGALLHDVGKVLTHEHDGTHVQLGVEMATKYGENPIVINCIGAHHDDVPHESPVSVIVQAADAISGSRPGARREAFETYVKRLTDLEKLASEFKGVDKVFAIQAGREVRVVVTPEAVDDNAAAVLTEEIARKIERELQYPGQIKVVVIRETRTVGVAR